ncbi:MAG TPA: SUMF1/EgtB/PvdO family nonheme iron enzyme, partial [Sphaerochaetaceae bacterium]|nr:SUMF1/EgtB/PvdO family nonheme iron enzyme [Sphaerochaetaceae bacterium]
YPAVAVPSRQPIRNISWYAAQAFVEWLGTITGTTVFLPTQDQWEYAAQHDRSAEHVLSGSLWEFTSDSFAPLARFTEIPNTWESDQAGVIVKGGSAVSVEAATDRASIGVLDRSACSETTGFRIAWID